MRSKDVDRAINNLKEDAELIVYGNMLCEEKTICKKDDLKTVLSYIETLEKENAKYKNFKLHISGMRSGKQLLARYINDSILKQEIRDKIKELEKALDKAEQLNASATRYDLIQKLNYKIETLNEIIGE